jgi:nucleoid-associated protein YgaU
MIARSSRYAHVPTAIHVDAAGRQQPYVLLRPLTEPTAIQAHTVVQGDRLDVLAFRAYRDAEQFWRICDANPTFRPDDLLEPGRLLRIPLAR